MDDSSIGVDASQSAGNIAAGNWQAELQLEFSRCQDRSVLTRRQHNGPLVIQKTLHPEGEGVCHGIIVHPPGGIAGGDQLALNVQLKQGAHALLTTPGAGKWYKANGRQASQSLDFKLGPEASLEWLPQENILYDGSQLLLDAQIELAGEAVYAGWEILCFGRQASNERWQYGELLQRLAIRRDSRLLWRECAVLQPGSRAMTSMAGLREQPVSGSFVIAAGSVPKPVMELCQQVISEDGARVGVTALPEIFAARYAGASSQAARQYFEKLWHILRPWYAGRQAIRPRIWNT